MSDEVEHSANGGGGGNGSGPNGKTGAGAANHPDRSVDRFGLVNLGLEIAHSGESLARMGSLAGKLRGDQLSAELLVIDGHMKKIEKLFVRTRAYIRAEAKLALDIAMAEEKSKGTP